MIRIPCLPSFQEMKPRLHEVGLDRANAFEQLVPQQDPPTGIQMRPPPDPRRRPVPVACDLACEAPDVVHVDAELVSELVVGRPPVVWEGLQEGLEVFFAHDLGSLSDHQGPGAVASADGC